MSEYIASYGVQSTPLFDFILPLFKSDSLEKSQSFYVGETKNAFYRSGKHILEFLSAKCSKVRYQLYLENETRWGTDITSVKSAVVDDFESTFDFVATAHDSCRGGIAFTGTYSGSWFVLLLIPSTKQKHVVDIKGFFTDPVIDTVPVLSSRGWEKPVSKTGVKELSLTVPTSTPEYYITQTIVSGGAVPIFTEPSQDTPAQTQVTSKSVFYHRFSSYPVSVFLYYPSVSEEEVLGSFI